MKVYLDAGHGGTDSGAVGINGRLERDDCQKLADLVVSKLQNTGITTIVNTNVNETLAEVANQANHENVDIFISIHRNAFDDPSANGLEVYTCPNPRAITKNNANIIYQKLLNVAHMRPRGLKEARFYVLTQTVAPAMLLEIGFVTNEKDNALFDQNIEAYANAIVSGILEIFGINKYIIQVGTYSTLIQANLVLADLKSKGYEEAKII